jgi:hypothetical protein
VTQPHPLTPDKGADPGVSNPWPYGYYAGSATFPNFLNLVQAAGTNAMITVNYGSSLGNFDAASGKWLSKKGGQPAEAAAWVAYANADASIYGTASDVDLGVDQEGIDWKTAGYWARLRSSTQAEYQAWAQADGVYDPVNNFLAANRDAPVGIKHWEIGNEINGNGYYATFWDWEEDLHGAYDGSRVNDPALSPTAYANNLIQFSALMKKVDPTIEIGAVLTGPADPGNTSDPAKNWDRNVLLTAGNAQVTVNGQNYNAVDFGILHWYVNNEPSDFNDTCDGSLAACESTLLSTVANNSAAANSLPFTYQELRNRVDLYTNRDPNTFPIHMTEFGYFDSIGNSNVVTGLFTADVYATALEEGADSVHFLEMSAAPFLSDTGGLTRGPAFRASQVLDQFFDSGDEMIDASSSSSNLKVHAVRQADGTVAVMLINLLTGAGNDAAVSLSIQGAPLDDTGIQWLYGGAGGSAPVQSSISGLGNTFTYNIAPRTLALLLIPAAILDGDFNGDGTVDAADYVVWRKTDGTQASFNLWRANFGRSLPGGGAGGAVPEPSTVSLVLLAILTMHARFSRVTRPDALGKGVGTRQMDPRNPRDTTTPFADSGRATQRN